MVVPEPEFVSPPGLFVTVHDPEAGNPLRVTLPVAIEQVGWLIVPMTGEVGKDGGLFMLT